MPKTSLSYNITNYYIIAEPGEYLQIWIMLKLPQIIIKERTDTTWDFNSPVGQDGLRRKPQYKLDCTDKRVCEVDGELRWMFGVQADVLKFDYIC
jgi:hypothetical protein